MGLKQKYYYFISLVTGKCLNQLQWDVFPMPQGAINWVHGLADAGGQKLITGAGPTFEWRPGQPIIFPNNESDKEYVPTDDDDTVNDKTVKVDIQLDDDEHNTDDIPIVLVDDDDFIGPPIDDLITITPDLPPPPPDPVAVNQGAPADVPAPSIEEEIPIE